MPEVLFVSKPIEPPWNDSSKNLARDIAAHLRRYAPVLMGRKRGPPAVPDAAFASVYRAKVSTGFSPSLRDRLDVLRYLMRRAPRGVWHFFFAPNQPSAIGGHLATTIRRASSVQTVCSMPPEDAALKKLVFADITVSLSRAAYNRFRAEGLSDEAVRLIPPCVPPLGEAGPSERARCRAKHGLPASSPIWIFPGDLEHGGGAEISLTALAAHRGRDALLLMACREKTSRASSAKSALIERSSRLGIERRVRWLGESSDIVELLAASDFVLMPNRSSFAKMDYPLVVLEAMCMARPVFVGARTPAAELAEEGGAIAVEPDGESLATSVQSWSDDRRALQEVQRRGRALVLERFAPVEVAAAYERLYDELHV